ncbi:MAG: leucine-rich repeat domain-containing protein [Clostridium sp.]|nr:leucine-rich repeat domain-containing protein [Clostridium sp.]
MSNTGQSKSDLGEIIYEIIKKYGNDIVEDVVRLNALLMDYAPDMAKERKLVINALKEGMLSQLRRYVDIEKNTLEAASNRCVALLVSEMWITESAAQYATNVMLQAMWHEKPIIISQSTDKNEDKTDKKQLVKGNLTFETVVREDELADFNSIGYKAFASNQRINEIYVPKNIKIIYPKAFKNCSQLKKIHLTGGTERIGRGVLDGCIGLETIDITNSNYFTSMNSLLIDKKAKILVKFYGESVKCSIINGIVTICEKAFERGNIEKIMIPSSIELIEENAFYCTMKLKEINVDPNNRIYKSIDGVLHSRDGRVLLRYPQGKMDVSYYLEDNVTKIERKAFSCAVNLVSITFDGDVKEISENAFEYCEAIENIILPRSVQRIGERAFQYCKKLSSVMLPQGIIRIGDCAFMGCAMLKTLSVPKSVREIGNMAFSNCKLLSKVVIQENVEFIGDKAFDGCPDVEIFVKGNEYVSTYCKVHGIRYSIV